ncbi:response regulator [Erythrobacter sp. LQ02-29]|uniref:response regulator n=1 Tax=unclassified Erythrobacter TaxID=2633097 RepID=UPI001BFCA6F5|nr:MULTISPECIES: response regulator [unclassified Erythrobacter]MCP9221610.1 response regulator [Erythrobacter sp. LQ02-29]QWC57125.1 response regulator [Erythrobacter sp. 3-20A1M]
MKSADGKAGEPRSGDGAGPLGSVLLVEDDAVLALATEDSLREAGASEVTTVATTAAALDQLRDSKFDLLILDVHLADRDDGWAIAELVAQIGPQPPRIIFSTGAPDSIPEEIAELGPVLEKPYDFSELVAHARAPRRKGLLALFRR